MENKMPTKICSCLLPISGRTKNTLKSNLKRHLKSNKHKKQLKMVRGINIK